MVSIIMITYGHEKYIEEAIKGVFIQRTSFPVELIIANDCSPDQSDEVVNKVLKNAPVHITVKYKRHDENKGMNVNFLWAIGQASGKYIALCEGDDYWTDPQKLQKQVDFLEANEEYIIHSGKAVVLKDNKLGTTIGDPLSKNTYVLADFYTKNNLVTCTATFRNILSSYPSFERLAFGDWKLYTILLSEKLGNLAYLADEIYSVYRIHEGGAMQKITEQYENAEAHLKQIESVNKNMSSQYSKQDIQSINSYCITIFGDQLKKNNYKKCFGVFFRNFFLVKYKLPFRNYVGLVKFYKFN